MPHMEAGHRQTIVDGLRRRITRAPRTHKRLGEALSSLPGLVIKEGDD